MVTDDTFGEKPRVQPPAGSGHFQEARIIGIGVDLTLMQTVTRVVMECPDRPDRCVDLYAPIARVEDVPGQESAPAVGERHG